MWIAELIWTRLRGTPQAFDTLPQFGRIAGE